MAVQKGEIGIYGILKNDTPDAIIAYAEQIKDTNENKNQQVINEELRTELDAVDALVDTKVDKVVGKGLSTNDYTTTEKNKLAGIANNANNYSLPTASASVLGGVKVGANLAISNGVLSATEQLKWRTIE